MTSYEKDIGEIYGIHEEAKNWKTGSIYIDVATSKANDLPLQLDLSSTIGHSKQVPIAGKRGDHNCYWLFSSICENNQK